MIKLIKKLLEIRFIRFLLVGGINTLFGYSLFSLFIFLELHHKYAVLYSTLLGIAFNYRTIGKLVFRDKEHSFFKILRFLFVYSIGYFINTNGINWLTKLGMNTYISGLFVIIPVSILIYFLNKKIVFPTFYGGDANEACK